jgi:hypothetical protein
MRDFNVTFSMGRSPPPTGTPQKGVWRLIDEDWDEGRLPQVGSDAVRCGGCRRLEGMR